VKESNEKVVEELEHLHYKVDKVQDTVVYIKKKITTVTPWRLAVLLLIAIILWTWLLFSFDFVNMNSKGT